MNISLLNNQFLQISQVTTPLTQVNSLSKNEIEILVANIDNLSQDEKDFIKSNLVEIAKGSGSTYSVNTIANKLYSNLFNKDGSLKSDDIISGFGAEFFLICILKDNNFEQCFCFRNLEENSAKKGFDGVYQKDGEVWISESKSSYARATHNNSHKTTIKRAYDGINNQLLGRTSNDPWENAANHALSSKSSTTLVAELEKLSEDYIDGNYKQVSDCNLIIGSTVIDVDIGKTDGDIKNFYNYISNHKALNEKIIAINLSKKDIFIDIMKEIAND